jgi:hypothetical protein
MRSIFSLVFWKDATERAIKSAAQAALGLWAVADQGFDVISVDWRTALVAAGSGAVLSILTSIISSPLSSDDSASLVG